MRSCAMPTTKGCTMFGFRFLVIENRLWSSTTRHIDVFLDERAFSEKNLCMLFRHFADNNPEPTQLTVSVVTSWDQLPPSSTCPPTAMSEMPDAPPNGFKATFQRFIRKQNQVFEYYEYNPKPDSNEMRKVVMTQ